MIIRDLVECVGGDVETARMTDNCAFPSVHRAMVSEHNMPAISREMTKTVRSSIPLALAYWTRHADQ
jgi:hypothetical protein